MAGRPGMISRFLVWWGGELRACLPQSFASFLFGARRRLEVDVTNTELRFHRCSNGQREEMCSVSRTERSGAADAQLSRALRRELRRVNGKVTVRLSSARVLRPRIVLPVEAAENLSEAIAFEMDRHTPFERDDVQFDFRVVDSDPELQRIEVDLEVARRDQINAAVTLLRGLGMTVIRVTGPVPPDGRDLGLNLVPETVSGGSGRLMLRLRLAAVSIASISVVLALGAWIDRQERILAQSEAKLAEMRASASAGAVARARANELDRLSRAVIDKRLARPAMIEILDDITRRLSDEHWLLTYSVRGDTIKMSGYSRDPSGLLHALEGSAYLTNASFAAPVTTDPRNGIDRFSVTAKAGWAEAAQ